ncbi:MAG: hypothetical protein A2036_01575 [Omnitrophica bacterium GWA2_50_21]|nr:MAG: hypothetical protein A2036_01575 [Omnitrophica bacterium GWA2_50_21]
MKKIIFALLAVVCAVSFSGVALAEAPSADLIKQGEQLFNAKEGLGVKFACIMCHKGQKAIKKSEVEKLGATLPDVINEYIVKKSKGTAIAKDSDQMKALVAYITNEHSV